MKRVCTISLALVLAGVLQACAGAPAAGELDAARTEYWQHPYQPEAINRLALALVAAGDRGGAEILLARAVRIAPDRADLRANLERLRAGSSRVGTVPTATPSSGARDEPPPPAAWPSPK
jgi:Flp pilus assembly protein TadD